MPMAIFLALTIIGGWFAWRRNPMYSAGKTAQVIVLFGGTISIVLGVFWLLLTWNMQKIRPVC